MRHLWISCIAFWCIGSVPGFTQDKGDALPPRFAAFAKNDRFRLLRVLGTPELPNIYHQASAFSGDGKRAVYAEDLSTGDDSPQLRSRLHLWEEGKRWPREIESSLRNVTALAMSADGSKLLIAGQILVANPFSKKDKRDKKKDAGMERELRAYLGLMDLNTGKAIQAFQTKETLIHCVALSPDGNTALAGYQSAVKRWDLKQHKELGIFKEPEVADLAFLPGGDRFLAGYHLGKAMLWDVNKDKPTRVYETRKDLTLAWWVAVSRDGKRFVLGDAENELSLMEIDTGKVINTLEPKKGAIDEYLTAVALADDGKTVLSVWSKAKAEPDDFAAARLVAWDGETNKTLWSHTVSYRGRVPSAVQGDKLLIGGGPNLFETWSIKDGKLLASRGGHKGTINAVVGSPRGDILSAGQEGIVITWRLGELTNKRAAHAGPITVMALSRDEKRLLAAGTDKTVKLWSADSDKPVHQFTGHSAAVTSLAISKSAGWAVSGSSDRAVKTWDLMTGKAIGAFIGHTEGVNAVAISPDELWLASASDDATIRIWPIKDGRIDPDREPLLLEHHKKSITCLAFSPDGKTLLSGSQDQTMKVWDWAKEKVTRTIPGHKNWITSLLYVDDKTVLTTSDDLSICWWEVATGKEIGQIDFGAVGDCPRCMALVGPDRLLVGTSGWLIYEFQMVPGAKSKTGRGK
jgi:WD40 repeat protein